jgi:hypothetical protein
MPWIRPSRIAKPLEAAGKTAGKQVLRIDPILDLVRDTPFACDHRVVAEMPPEIISQLLRSAIHLPTPQHVKIEVVQ